MDDDAGSGEIKKMFSLLGIAKKNKSWNPLDEHTHSFWALNSQRCVFPNEKISDNEIEFL